MNRNLPLAATCTFAVRYFGLYLTDPDTLGTTAHLDKAHLWLRPIDESEESRAAWMASVAKRLGYPGHLVPVRAR